VAYCKIAPIGLGNFAALSIMQLWQQEKQRLSPPDCQMQASLDDVTHNLEPLLHRENFRYPYVLINLGRAQWLEGRCSEAVAAWIEAWELGVSYAAFELLWAGEVSALPQDTRITLARAAYFRGLRAERQNDRDAARQWYEREFLCFPERKSAQRLRSIIWTPTSR